MSVRKEMENSGLKFSPSGYARMVEAVCSTADGAAYWQLFMGCLDSCGYIFEELPLYYCYYRHFVPMAYRHPEFDAYDNSFWNLLFQMLFAEKDDTTMIDGNGNLPEIEFTFGDGERRTVSSLSLDELKALAQVLATNAFAETEANLIDMGAFGFPHCNDDSPFVVSKKAFLAEFFDVRTLERERQEILERLYQRIVACDFRTFPFRLSETRCGKAPQ